MCELPCPCLECKRSTSESSVVSESCDTAAFVGEEFEVKESSATARESREDLLPAGLLLVAMCELNMDMLEGDCTKSVPAIEPRLRVVELTFFNRQLLQPNDDVIRGSFAPCVFWHQCSTNLLKLAVIKYALWTTLNIDSIPRVDKNFGSGGSQCGSMFESLAH